MTYRNQIVICGGTGCMSSKSALIKEAFVRELKENNLEDIAKLLLPLASTTDLVLSGNYQALYEFCSLRNCTRVEAEIRELSLQLTKILKEIMPEIFGDLGCKGDELGYCPETIGSCGKYPQKGGK